MNILEIKVEQKRKLYLLLDIAHNNKEENFILTKAISSTKAEMDKEDVAYVEKEIERIYGK